MIYYNILIHFMGILNCLFCRITEVEPKYYADGENAYEMKRDLSDLFKKVSKHDLVLKF